MKKVIKGFVNYHDNYGQGERFSIETFSMKGSQGYLEVCPIELEIDIPDDFSPEKAEIEMLMAKKAAYVKQFEESIEKINKRLSELSALEYTIEASE